MSSTTPDAPPPGPPIPPPAPGAYPPPAAPAYGAPPSYGSAPAYGSAAPYGSAPGYGYGYGAAPRTNTLAIVSLIASIAGLTLLPVIGSIVGVITGHISLGQLKTSGEQGRGLALGGTIAGWAGLGLVILAIVGFFAFMGFVASVSTGVMS